MLGVVAVPAVAVGRLVTGRVGGAAVQEVDATGHYVSARAAVPPPMLGCPTTDPARHRGPAPEQAMWDTGRASRPGPGRGQCRCTSSGPESGERDPTR